MGILPIQYPNWNPWLKRVKLNEFNNVDEIENLVENLKQVLIQDYKSTSFFQLRISNVNFRFWVQFVLKSFYIIELISITASNDYVYVIIIMAFS